MFAKDDHGALVLIELKRSGAADCGIFHAFYKRDFRSDPLQLLQLNGRNWERVSDFNPLEAFFNGLNLNRQFADDLLREIGSRDHGGIFEF